MRHKVASRIDWRGRAALIGLSAAGSVGSVVIAGFGHWGWGLAGFFATFLILLRLLLS